MPELPLKYDAQGLVPAVLQDRITGDIRMFAYANDTAVRKTLETGNATWWSRSRGELWQRGRVSGQTTPVRQVLADCDGDCVVYSSEPQGPSCHSGATSCFFHAVAGESLEQASEQPQTVLASLEAEGGAQTTPSVAAAGFLEQAGKLAHALERESDERVVVEAAEAIYRLLAGLRSRSIRLRGVLAALAYRKQR
jgi:phosphoribosyl-ATP pyrophosphohydrolase/phosphoribosyl-AMP cyclohydrolase